jgi:hypothetical protein
VEVPTVIRERLLFLEESDVLWSEYFVILASDIEVFIGAKRKHKGIDHTLIPLS